MEHVKHSINWESERLLCVLEEIIRLDQSSIGYVCIDRCLINARLFWTSWENDWNLEHLQDEVKYKDLWVLQYR